MDHLLWSVLDTLRPYDPDDLAIDFPTSQFITYARAFEANQEMTAESKDSSTWKQLGNSSSANERKERAEVIESSRVPGPWVSPNRVRGRRTMEEEVMARWDTVLDEKEQVGPRVRDRGYISSPGSSRTPSPHKAPKRTYQTQAIKE